MRGTEIAVAGNDDAVAVLEKRAGIQKMAIAVDNQTGILREHGGDAEVPRQRFGQRTRADVAREMAASGKGIEPHVPERLRQPAARVIANEQNGNLGNGVNDEVRRRLRRRQQDSEAIERIAQRKGTRAAEPGNAAAATVPPPRPDV